MASEAPRALIRLACDRASQLCAEAAAVSGLVDAVTEDAAAEACAALLDRAALAIRAARTVLGAEAPLVVCEACNGTGADPTVLDEVPCGVCRGAGVTRG